MKNTISNISKQDIEKLKDQSISVREHSELIARIDEKVDEIVRYLSTNFSWWDYANGNYDAEGSTGWFDPNKYSKVVSVHGDFSFDKNIDYYYGTRFPTEWLWLENWKEIADKTIGKIKAERETRKQEKKNKALERKKKLEELQKSIKAKLTKEELKAIAFKK